MDGLRGGDDHSSRSELKESLAPKLLPCLALVAVGQIAWDNPLGAIFVAATGFFPGNRRACGHILRFQLSLSRC